MKDKVNNEHYDNPIDETFLNTAWENMSRRLDEELPIVPVLPLYSSLTPHRPWLVAAGLLLLLSTATWVGYAFGKHNALATQAATPSMMVKEGKAQEPITHRFSDDTNTTTSHTTFPSTRTTSLEPFLFTPIFLYAPSSSTLATEPISNSSMVPSNLPMLTEGNASTAVKIAESEPIPNLTLGTLASTMPKTEKALWSKREKAPRLPHLHVALHGGIYKGNSKDLIGGEYGSILLAKKSNKWTFETGLTYSFLKVNQQINYGIVVPESPNLGSGGSTNSPSRQVNIGFHINNLHYLGLPLGVSCRTSNRLSINAGLQFNHLVRVRLDDSFNAPNLNYNNARFFNANELDFDEAILGNTTAGDFNHNNIGANMGFTYHLSSKLGLETNYYWNMRPYWKSYEGHQSFYHGNLQMGVKYWLR